MWSNSIQLEFYLWVIKEFPWKHFYLQHRVLCLIRRDPGGRIGQIKLILPILPFAILLILLRDHCNILFSVSVFSFLHLKNYFSLLQCRQCSKNNRIRKIASGRGLSCRLRSSLSCYSLSIMCTSILSEPLPSYCLGLLYFSFRMALLL